MMRNALGALALGVAVTAVAPLPMRAEPAGQTAVQSAQAALVAGNTEMARILALAALQDRPDDPDAFAVLAAVALTRHEAKAAGQVALKSWKASESRAQRFTAARLVARAAYAVDAHEYAKLWLRRAVQNAPDEATRAATIRDFQTVRAASPLTFELGLSVTPSDNLNQGVSDPVLVIDGRPTHFTFDGATMALSGVEASLSFGARYRLQSSDRGRTDLSFRLRHKAVALSAEAKRLAPAVSASDLATWELETGIQRSLALSQQSQLRAGISLGQSWQGGAAYATTTRATLDVTHAFSRSTRIRFGLTAEDQNRAAAAKGAVALTMDGGIEHVLASGDRLALRLELGETQSSDANQENTRIGSELRYLKAEPVAGARVSAALGLGYRDYPVFFSGVFGDSGRQETAISASVDLALPAFGAFGFEPVVTLKGSRTLSNVSRYDTKALGLGVSLRSSF